MHGDACGVSAVIRQFHNAARNTVSKHALPKNCVRLEDRKPDFGSRLAKRLCVDTRDRGKTKCGIEVSPFQLLRWHLTR
jgi:hypothetical protein